MWPFQRVPFTLSSPSRPLPLRCSPSPFQPFFLSRELWRAAMTLILSLISPLSRLSPSPWITLSLLGLFFLSLPRDISLSLSLNIHGLPRISTSRGQTAMRASWNDSEGVDMVGPSSMEGDVLRWTELRGVVKWSFPHGGEMAFSGHFNGDSWCYHAQHNLLITMVPSIHEKSASIVVRRFHIK